MKLKINELEIYDAIKKGNIALVLTDINQDLTFNGHVCGIYEEDKEMVVLGVEHLIGIKRVYVFSYDVVKGSLID